MLVNHDLYEDDDDDFCCGRAYGGSRVAIVSTARYNPLRDVNEGVERTHAWPASHCSEHIDEMCRGGGQGKQKINARLAQSQRTEITTSKTSPDFETLNHLSSLQRAVLAHTACPFPKCSDSQHQQASKTFFEGLWLSRVCKTASHELGHCFGIGHCVYYACIMQGTASLAEDARQPPYLCPVDLEKVCRATGVGKAERYRIMGEVCGEEKFWDISMFMALRAWLGWWSWKGEEEK